MGPTRPLFFYFCPFLITISIIQIEKSSDGELGTWTRGRRMVGTDKTKEPWWPPTRLLFTFPNAWRQRNVATDDWFRTEGLCGHHQPLYQLRHSHCLGLHHTSFKMGKTRPLFHLFQLFLNKKHNFYIFVTNVHHESPASPAQRHPPTIFLFFVLFLFWRKYLEMRVLVVVTDVDTFNALIS